MREIVIATSNGGKLAEFAALLGPLGFTVRAQSVFGVSPAEETGQSFIENAILKARHAAAGSGLPALGDDSGLAVQALDGAPGIRSARFAGEPCDDAANNRELLRRLEGLPEERRAASFHCALALVRHPLDPVPLVCTGRWDGRILESPRGRGGFGYDPLFLVPALGLSAAELAPDVKNRLSHRARAFERLRASLEDGC